MKHKDYQRTLEFLSKLLSYILRHHPDEYGLVLDEEGFVSIKELHQAIIEDKAWSFVRKAHIMDVVNLSNRKRFEIKDGKIRATYGHSLPVKLHYEPVVPPKILYHATSRRSYPYILEKGLLPMGRQYVHLTVNKELALRIGKRRDNKPVLIKVWAQKAYEAGITFYCPNELIYLTKRIPPTFFSGPSLKKVAVKKRVSKEETAPPSPATFVLSQEMIESFWNEKKARAERYARKKQKKRKK